MPAAAKRLADALTHADRVRYRRYLADMIDEALELTLEVGAVEPLRRAISSSSSMGIVVLVFAGTSCELQPSTLVEARRKPYVV